LTNWGARLSTHPVAVRAERLVRSSDGASSPRSHPPRPHKDDRGHVRAQRERHIARRFAASKQVGWSPRLNPDPRWVTDERAADTIRQVLADGGENPSPPAFTGGLGWPRPELVRQLPVWVLKQTGDAVTYGQLADRHAFYVECSGCRYCKPYRYDPG
jgi:hypothetical protein